MDTVIIGGGLTGLLLTHRMHQAGHKVTLLEARDHLGGSHRRPMLNFFAATRSNMELCVLATSCKRSFALTAT